MRRLLRFLSLAGLLLLYVWLVGLAAGCHSAPNPCVRFVFGQVRPMTPESRQAIEQADAEMTAAARGIVFPPSPKEEN